MWDRIARLVRGHPLPVLGVSLALLVAPTLALPALRLSFDIPAELPSESDSVRGIRTLARSFGPGQVQPVVVIVRSDKSIWTDESFQAIDDLTVNLEKVPGVTGTRSITRPSEGGVSPQQMRSLGLGGLATLTDRLPRAAEGLRRAVEGLRLMRDGLQEIRASVPSQEAGAERALEGIRTMREGIARIREGLARLNDGLLRLRRGLERLAGDVAAPTLRALQAAWDDLRDSTVAKADPQYDDLARHVGEALAAVSGRCPDATGIGPQPADCPAGQKIDPSYDGLGPTLLELASATGRAAAGVSRLHGGLGEIDGGLARLEDGLATSKPRLQELEEGVGRMIEGLDRIVPGLERLRKGLAVASTFIEDTGLSPQPGEVALTATLVEAFPQLERELAFFVGEDGRATRVYVTLEASPYTPGSLEASRRIREVARLSLRETPLQDAEVLSTGAAPFFADMEDVSTGDLPTIVVAVVIGVFLVLALLLRSVVAPFYLVATVLLSFASTLGLTVLVFQGILGEAGLVWWLPIFLFVVLVALGADYNILLMGRIREEAGRASTREAVLAGLSATGHVITSAGLILAGTFAALLAAPLEGMVQMGFAATAGILVDTFVVRSLMVPSIAMLIGSGSWWPSARAQQA